MKQKFNSNKLFLFSLLILTSCAKPLLYNFKTIKTDFKETNINDVPKIIYSGYSELDTAEINDYDLKQLEVFTSKLGGEITYTQDSILLEFPNVDSLPKNVIYPKHVQYDMVFREMKTDEPEKMINADRDALIGFISVILMAVNTFIPILAFSFVPLGLIGLIYGLKGRKALNPKRRKLAKIAVISSISFYVAFLLLIGLVLLIFI